MKNFAYTYTSAGNAIKEMRKEIAEKQQRLDQKIPEVLKGMIKFFQEVLKEHPLASHELSSHIWGIYYDDVAAETKGLYRIDTIMASCYHSMVTSDEIKSIRIVLENPGGDYHAQIEKICEELTSIEGFAIEASCQLNDPQSTITLSRRPAKEPTE